MNYIFDIEPNRAPRMVRSDKYAKRPVVERYFAFRNFMRLRANILKCELTPVMEITFIITMPASWSKKKRLEMDGKPHQQDPDIDNLIKAVLDSFGKEDNFVWRVTAQKIWGKSGKVIIHG